MNQRTDEPTNQPTDQRTNQPTNQPTNRQKTCPLKPSHIFPLLDLLIFASLLAFTQICFSRSLRYSLTHLSNYVYSGSPLLETEVVIANSRGYHLRRWLGFETPISSSP